MVTKTQSSVTVTVVDRLAFCLALRSSLRQTNPDNDRCSNTYLIFPDVLFNKSGIPAEPETHQLLPLHKV